MRLFKTGNYVSDGRGYLDLDGLVICLKGLQGWFDVSKDVRSVHFEAYDRPSKWRQKFLVDGRDVWCIFLRWGGYSVDPNRDDLLKNYVGRTIYVECYYE